MSPGGSSIHNTDGGGVVIRSSKKRKSVSPAEASEVLFDVESNSNKENVTNVEDSAKKQSSRRSCVQTSSI
jgi:hypothetical protein